MKEQQVSIKVSKQLKDVGIDLNWCNGEIDVDGEIYPKISQTLAQKWLREVHNINVESNYLPNIQKYRALFVPMEIIPKTFKSARKHYDAVRQYLDTTNYNTYEEALDVGIYNAIQIVKSRNDGGSESHYNEN